MSRLLIARVTALCLLTFSSGQPTADSLTTEACPLIPGCCEEDCCGEGTSWDLDTQYCVDDPKSSGFNGTYSDAWETGCVERFCCGADCCNSDLRYDESAALCLPTPAMIYTIEPGENDLFEREVTEIYEQCSSGNKVYLRRIWSMDAPECSARPIVPATALSRCSVLVMRSKRMRIPMISFSRMNGEF